MDELIKLLDKNLDYHFYELVGDKILIHTKSNRTEVECPFCGTLSKKVHSTYTKSFQDLPIQGKKVIIYINNRKMLCRNELCKHTTFAEFFSCVEPNAKKSIRSIKKIRKLSLSVSSITASKLPKDGIADVGKSSICELLKKRESDMCERKYN